MSSLLVLIFHFSFSGVVHRFWLQDSWHLCTFLRYIFAVQILYTFLHFLLPSVQVGYISLYTLSSMIDPLPAEVSRRSRARLAVCVAFSHLSSRFSDVIFLSIFKQVLVKVHETVQMIYLQQHGDSLYIASFSGTKAKAEHILLLT